jgi:hypothetical protein
LTEAAPVGAVRTARESFSSAVFGGFVLGAHVVNAGQIEASALGSSFGATGLAFCSAVGCGFPGGADIVDTVQIESEAVRSASRATSFVFTAADFFDYDFASSVIAVEAAGTAATAAPAAAAFAACLPCATALRLTGAALEAPADADAGGAGVS